MTTISGSEVARLVLRYLQSQQMDKVALDFCKLSPYLREEYGILKRGLKLKELNKYSLINVVKDFIEYEEIVTELFQNELDQYDQIPIEMLRARTLRDKLLYLYGLFSEKKGQSSQSMGVTTAQKRSNISIMPDYDSDSTDMSTPRATDEQDLPGYSGAARPPRPKRRKLYDPTLLYMINDKSDVASNDGNKSEQLKATPLKPSASSQDPTSTKKLIPILGQHLSESLLTYISPKRIADQINIGFGAGNISLDQLPNKMDEIVTTFDDIVESLRLGDYDNSSSGASKTVSDAEFDNNRQLETPLPTDASQGCRYDLRSNRKSSSNLASAESKRKRNSKIQILSDEQINPPSGSEVVIVSDEEPVSTTSQSQQVQQTQFQAVGMTGLYNGVPFIAIYDPESNSIKLTPVSQERNNFVTEPMHPSTTSVQNQMIGNVIDSSGYMIATDQSNNQIINFVDNNAVIGSNILSNQFITETTSNQIEPTNNGGENRMIVVVTDDVNREGTQPVQMNQQPSSEIPKEVPKEQSHETNLDQTKEKPNPMAQFKIISGQKVVTPKQLIKPNIPSSSRSLSTPRDKIKKVLDFNTPNRFRLAEIMEFKNESGSNTSRFFNETPHNRTITSSLSRSAPPKVDSAVQSRRASIEKSLELNDVFVPADENTVVSVEGETPKVRKNNRRSCVRTISAHKEINSEENEKRLHRVAVAKKKICPDDADSNGSEKSDQIDAAEEWKRQKEARNKPIDQIVREQNSKKEENRMPTGRKRSRRCNKKPPPKKSNIPAKSAIEKLSKSEKTLDVSLNSSLDISMNSTLQNEGKMLEENLKSAKKVTPMKHIIQRSAKKKTPIGKKLQIKLPTKSPKNKALKKIKSAKIPVADQTNDAKKADSVENNAVLGTEVGIQSESKANEMEIDLQPNDQAQIYVSENTTDDLEVAQNLINMQEVILQQESEKKKAQQPSNPEIQSDSVSMSVSQPVEEVTVSKTLSHPLPVEKISSNILKSIAQPNLSLSSLLETPYKDNGLAFPRTPGLNSIMPQLTTPMILRPCESLMDDSIFKNPLFPTPNFPITPGSIFTPFKDMLSPCEEVVYGAPNRPTDYSSSSSYYKPDESDGIDKQIQASVRSAQTNSGVYSADEIDDSSKIDDTTQNTSRASSSSSSSSSSDSDSDSDTDSSSSSDSETSQISQKASEPIAGAEQNQNVPTVQPIDVIDEDTTQIIKSHLGNTAEVNIAQNILLSEPEPIQCQAFFDKEREQIKLLDEKRRRMQESLRQDELKNRDKMRPKQTKKYQRNITEAKRERLRGAPAIVSPSKRKSSQPMKVVSIQNQQIYSKVVNVVSSQPMKLDEVEIKTQCVTTERLISEAAGDNAIVDASDVSTTQNTRNPIEEEESVEAIKSHITKSRHLTETIPSQKNIAPTQLSPEGLVDMLCEKQKKLNANRPKTKTEVIAPLPLTRATRARTRSQKIRPISTIFTKPTESSSKVSTKQSVPTIKDQKQSNDNKETDRSSQKPKTIARKSEPGKAEPSKVETVKAAKSIEGLVKPEYSLETPAKKKVNQQIRDIFGDCTDIDTPVKSPPKKITQKKPEEQLEVECNPPSKPLRKSPRTSPVPQIDKPSNKYEADSSTVQDESDSSDDSDDSDDSDSEDDSYELALSIDESDKRRFLSIRENASAMPKAAVTSQTVDIKPWKLNIDGVNIVLAASDIEELYTQDIDSVAEMKKGRRSGKEIRTDGNSEPTSSSEAIYGKPLHTSTPSPTKTITPKFNIKHKTSTTVSPKSAKKQNAGKGENYFNGIKIDDVLFHLHPTNE